MRYHKLHWGATAGGAEFLLGGGPLPSLFEPALDPVLKVFE